MQSLPTIAVCGLGRLGTHLARALLDAHLPLRAVVTSQPEHARRMLPGVRVAPTPQAMLVCAEIIFLAVPDRTVHEMAAALACCNVKGKTFVHCSGALLADTLEPLQTAGASIGVFHPLQAMPPKDTPLAHSPLRGCFVGIEAKEPLHPMLASVARAIGAIPFTLPPFAADRARYHLGAVLASNALVVLADAAATILAQSGLGEQAASMLVPLIRGTLDNIERDGPARALTGPVARGDTGTLENHLACLRGQPELTALYRETMLGAATLALEDGRIDQAAYENIRKLLTS